ncbi:hypothetical protein OIM90_17250 [Streptomyces sp. AD16]|nr:hypothetical protein OIM90_17250 [Streptomyces sp. AD16]
MGGEQLGGRLHGAVAGQFGRHGDEVLALRGRAVQLLHVLLPLALEPEARRVPVTLDLRPLVDVERPEQAGHPPVPVPDDLGVLDDADVHLGEEGVVVGAGVGAHGGALDAAAVELLLHVAAELLRQAAQRLLDGGDRLGTVHLDVVAPLAAVRPESVVRGGQQELAQRGVVAALVSPLGGVLAGLGQLAPAFGRHLLVGSLHHSRDAGDRADAGARHQADRHDAQDPAA